MPAAIDLQFVDETVARLGRRPDTVIPVLQALQDHYGFLPEEALRRVCESTDITPASIAGVASFYDQFRHKPVGRHIVQICRGTACHVNGAERVEDALRHLHDPAFLGEHELAGLRVVKERVRARPGETITI